MFPQADEGNIRGSEEKTVNQQLTGIVFDVDAHHALCAIIDGQDTWWVGK